MRAIAFSVEGYRRFVAKTSVKLHGDMAPFVGPNEAGKSSLLRARAHLRKDGGFEPNELPRRTQHQPCLAWHLQLDEADKLALSELPGTESVERAIGTKHGDGSRSWDLEPGRPRRDRSRRAAAAKLMRGVRDLAELAAADVADEWQFNLGDFDRPGKPWRPN